MTRRGVARTKPGRWLSPRAIRARQSSFASVPWPQRRSGDRRGGGGPQSSAIENFTVGAAGGEGDRSSPRRAGKDCDEQLEGPFEAEASDESGRYRREFDRQRPPIQATFDRGEPGRGGRSAFGPDRWRTGRRRVQAPRTGAESSRAGKTRFTRSASWQPVEFPRDARPGFCLSSDLAGRTALIAGVASPDADRGPLFDDDVRDTLGADPFAWRDDSPEVHAGRERKFAADLAPWLDRLSRRPNIQEVEFKERLERQSK